MKLFEIRPLNLGDYGRILCQGVLSSDIVLSGCHPFEPLIMPMSKLCVSAELEKALSHYFAEHLEVTTCSWGKVVAKNWRQFVQGTEVVPPPGGEPIDYLEDGEPIRPDEPYSKVDCKTVLDMKSPTVEEVLRDPNGQLTQPRQFERPVSCSLPPIFAARFFGSVSNYFVTTEFWEVINRSQLGDAVEIVECSPETGMQI